MSDFPADLEYTKDHEWAKTEGNRLRVGITSFAVEQLGDITLVTIDAKDANGSSSSTNSVFVAEVDGKVVICTPAPAK